MFPMIKMAVLKKGRGHHRIWVAYMKCPGVVIAHLGGGANHLGAITLGLQKWSRTFLRSGHPDYILTKFFSRSLLKHHRGFSMVSAGVHYPRIGKNNILKIVEQAKLIGCQIAKQ